MVGERFADSLYLEMQERLQQVAMDAAQMMQRAQRSYAVAEDYLLKLRDLMSDYTFADSGKEVIFFKNTKPQFHKELIYWSEIMQIEANRPIATGKSSKRYLKQVLLGIDQFFTRHKWLYHYYKTGADTEDLLLFLRNGAATSLPLEDTVDLDPNFSTRGSTMLAKIMAMEEVLNWINTWGKRAVQNESATNSHKLTWTGSKAQLIELVYALESYGVFNNGKTNVKEVMAYLQYCFNVEKVSNYYGYFQGMRIRKKDRTPFLNGLIDFTIRRMDASDEFPRFS